MRHSKKLTGMVMALIIVIFSHSGLAQDNEAARDKLFGNIRQMMIHGDWYRAIQFISRQESPEKAGEIYNNLVRDFYWKEKSLPDVIAFARAGIQYCLMKSDDYKAEDPELSFELKNSARKISYNLASFCWPGWKEEGIIISANDRAIGLDAARLCIRLAEELQLDNTSMATNYWLLGAQQLAAQDYETALNTFYRSKDFAHQSGEKLSELLADGYIGITMIVSGDKNGQKELGEVIEGMTKDGSEDALFYIDQFNTALDVFIK